MKVVPDAVADKATEESVLLCPRWNNQKPLRFADNLTGQCSICGHEVEFRPNAPKKPRRICLECLPKAIAASEDKEHQFVITETAKKEVDLYFGKTDGKSQ